MKNKLGHLTIFRKLSATYKKVGRFFQHRAKRIAHDVDL
jgi:hypothetical protein